MNELVEQLNRCKEWLKVEPDDIEVQEKVKELEKKINDNNEEKEKEDLLLRIDGLEKEIRSLKRDINSKLPHLKGFEKEMGMLKIVDNSLKEVKIKIFNKKVNEYNELVKEYIKRFGNKEVQ